ncbi:MAG: DUF4097 family beta strand repeat-containing protein, partial [Longimicrobiales bacterium]
REGDYLVLKGFSGVLAVEGWSRTEIRAEADTDERLLFRFSRSGNRIELEVLDRKDRNRSEDLRLLIPTWMPLEVSGPNLDVDMRGLSGEVRIRNLKGDLVLRELSGNVDASTVEGSIDAVGLGGRARLTTGNDDITVLDARAQLVIESVSGDVEIRRSSAPGIEVRTTDGDVDFTGRFLPAGVYEFRSHSGDLTFTLEAPVNAKVTVLAYEGEFESDFPVRTDGFRSGQNLDFTIGEGGARVLLEAFDGEVTLRRGGAGDPDQGAPTRSSRGGRLLMKR